MAKNKQCQKVGGAVLVMILIVMMVLIIMLMATLTVVTTAGQRIYTKFEENQAYYSARSALDVFTQNMLNDAEYYAYDDGGDIRYLNDDGTTAMKQGLALQLELYKIESQGIKTAKVADGMSISNTTKDNGLLYAENMNPDDIFASGSDESDNYSVESGLDSITYYVTLPNLTDPNATGTDQTDYGEMVDFADMDGDGVRDDHNATIKVEVLDRVYDMAGNYGSNDKEIRETILNIFEEGDATKIAKLKDDIKAGSRDKDKFTLKITSTVYFQGRKGTAVLIYDSIERPAVNSSKAITSVNDVTEGSGLFALGGASSLKGTIDVDEGAIVYDSLFLKGDLRLIDSADGMHMFKDTIHTIIGNFTAGNQPYPTCEEEGSVFYVNGTTTFSVQGDFGASGKETNLVSNVIQLNSNAKQMSFYGNMYCDKFVLEDADDAQAPTISGKIYTNYVDLTAYFKPINSLTDTLIYLDDETVGETTAAKLEGRNVGAIASKFNIAKGFVINIDGVPTNVEWDGNTNLTTYDAAGNVLKTYTIDSELGTLAGMGFTYSSGDEVKITYNNPDHYEFKEGMKEFTLPAALEGRGGTDKLEVPTVQSLYGEIFKQDAFVANTPDTGTNGELDNVAMPVFDTSAYSFTHTLADSSSYVIPDVIIQAISSGELAVVNSAWDLQPYVDAGSITSEDANTIAANWNDVQTSWWPTAEFNYGIKTSVQTQIDTLKASDTDYQEALVEYYDNYILGAERAGEELLKYTSDTNEIVVKSMADAATPEDFEAGGAYEGTYGGIIDSSGFLASNSASDMYGTPTAPYVIDARTNDIIIQLGEGSIPGGICKILGYFVVVGDNNVKMYLPDGRDYELGSTASGQGFYLSTYDIHNATELRLGNDAMGTPIPHVYMYVGDNVDSVSFKAPGADRFFTGYIYAPFSHFNMGANTAVTFDDVYYNGDLVPITDGTAGFTVVGSLIAKSYTSSNKSGVAYISPDKSTIKPGDPHLSWTPDKYTRN